MSTTFYFTTTSSTPVSPSISSLWDSSAATDFVRRHCHTTDGGSTSDQETTETTSLGEKMCQIQYVSTNAITYAQTISGDFTISTSQEVSATGATDFSYVIRVVTSAGSVRGTLYDGTSSAISVPGSYGTVSDSGTFSSVACSVGDYIVIELGYEVNNTGSKTFGTRAGTGSVVMDYDITVMTAPTALTYTPSSGTILKDFSSGIFVPTYSGGVGGVTFSVSSGALPTGMTVNSSTGGIGGTPTVAGDFTATIQVTNASGSDTESITITVERLSNGGWSLVPKL